MLVHSLPRQSKKSSHSCCFTCFSGGIFAGLVSDKTKCSGITVVFMLILAAPMVSQLHNCTRERLKESFLFDFLVAMHCYEASQRRVSGAKDFAVTNGLETKISKKFLDFLHSGHEFFVISGHGT